MSDAYASEFKKVFAANPVFARGVLSLYLADGILPPFDTLRTALDVWTPNPVPPLGIPAFKRMMKEYKGSMKNPPANISWGSIDYDDFSGLQATILGPEGSPYAGGMFFLDITIPRDYPFKAPRVRLTTKVYHPNISQAGGISLDVLNDMWSPALTVTKVLLSIGSLLTDPDPDSPAVPEVASIYKNDRPAFDKTAVEWTRKYANSVSRKQFEEVKWKFY